MILLISTLAYKKFTILPFKTMTKTKNLIKLVMSKERALLIEQNILRLLTART